MHEDAAKAANNGTADGLKPSHIIGADIGHAGELPPEPGPMATPNGVVMFDGSQPPADTADPLAKLRDDLARLRRAVRNLALHLSNDGSGIERVIQHDLDGAPYTAYPDCPAWRAIEPKLEPTPF